jgi:hypothetical protein
MLVEEAPQPTLREKRDLDLLDEVSRRPDVWRELSNSRKTSALMNPAELTTGIPLSGKRLHTVQQTRQLLHVHFFCNGGDK